MQSTDDLDARIDSLIAFWREAGPDKWFAKDADFDRRFRDGFLDLHEAAARGELEHWGQTARGSLALVLLLDQLPRNVFRDTPRMFATDEHARRVADAAIAAGHDQSFDQDLRTFLYLPFEHSESLADQERSLALFRDFNEMYRSYAQVHYDIIQRFGRFPHRNRVLGRTTSVEEQAFLDAGGFAG